MQQSGWRLGVKRAIDVGGAVAALIALSPVIALTSAAVWIAMGSPVLFRQARAGRHGSPFDVIKFRTMRDAYESDGTPLADQDRMTRTGQLMRSLSLDELPQLLNVVRGEMSLVGPRPHLLRYLARYNVQQARRHDVLPGITGWAQVNGRNSVTYEQRFELDVWYVKNWSLALDARILWLTLRTVLKRSGVSSSGHVTMAEFMGTEGE